MSLFGKILAVFNVLAAIGFLVVAGMDYNKRQSWAYSHFLHQLQVNGLPLDKDDDTGRLPGRTISDQFGKDANKVLFPSGGPMTQTDAVTETVAAFKNAVNNAPDINAKRAIIAEHLLPELTRAEDRDEVIRELQALSDPAGIDKLFARFDNIVDQTKKGEREAKRRAIADFLYDFQYTNDWQKRVQGVVGLEQYVAAAERQSTRLQEMIARDRRTIAESQAAFVAQYQANYPELQVLANQFQALDARLTELKEQEQKHTALRNARKTEVAKLTTELTEQKAAEAKELAALAALQQELFAVQQDVFKAQERNQQLERDLRAKESEK
jgi:acyl carrier protein phosphodiesterase